MQKLTKISLFSAAIMASMALTASAASAATVAKNHTKPAGEQAGQHQQGPAVVGSVTSINGTIIILSGRQGFGQNTAAASEYTIDAGSAAIKKVGAATDGKPSESDIAISDIKIGDNLMVQGTISGTAVKASEIRDGVMGGAGRGGNNASSTPRGLKNEDHSGAVGTITAINGNTITMSSKKMSDKALTDVAYSVDATTAKIVKGMGAESQTIAITDLAVGNTINVKGTITESSIAATSISVFERPEISSSTDQFKGRIEGQDRAKGGFFSNIVNPIKNFFNNIFKK